MRHPERSRFLQAERGISRAAEPLFVEFTAQVAPPFSRSLREGGDLPCGLDPPVDFARNRLIASDNHPASVDASYSRN
jgi:hypothetical protein